LSHFRASISLSRTTQPRRKQTYIHALIVIRTHDPCVQVAQDMKHLIPANWCGRLS